MEVRRGLTCLLVLPAIVVGSQVAHAAAYWWAYPQANLRITVLSESGHGYMAYAPAVLGFLAAAQLVAFLAVAVDRARGRPLRGVAAWVFLLIPELGFVLQEHLERMLATGLFPWWTSLEPSFWRGLVLQLPLALAAYLVAAVLLRTASAVGEALRGRRGNDVVVPRRYASTFRPATVFLPRLAPLAEQAADRAPPLPAH